MRKTVSLMFPVIAAAALMVAAASPGIAAPEPAGPGGIGDSALLTVIGSVGDDAFSTVDLTTLIDPSGTATGHFGPYSSSSTDSGTCGNDWANDTFDRHFTVHNNSDGSITVIEQFKNGQFMTPASDSPPTNFSPGACQQSSTPAGTVDANVTGDLHGYFVIPLPAGEKQTLFDSSCVAGSPSAPCTTTDFINTHFTPACYPTTCPVTTFFFHYSAGDQSLIDHEWKNASADRGGNSGDVRSTNI